MWLDAVFHFSTKEKRKKVAKKEKRKYTAATTAKSVNFFQDGSLGPAIRIPQSAIELVSQSLALNNQRDRIECFCFR